MLTSLYFIGIVTSIMVPIFKYREEYKNALISASISIFCGILYAIPAVYNILANPNEPDFWTIFKFLALEFWIFALLSNNGSSFLIYIFTAFLMSGLLCIFCPKQNAFSYSVPCNQNHDYIETQIIVSTYDGSKNGESIFGDSYVIGVFRNPPVKGRIFKYFYLAEDGSIKSNKIVENRTEITYIRSNAQPYVEIHYSIKCSGYKPYTETHSIRSTYKTYHLYIPENSIISIPPENY